MTFPSFDGVFQVLCAQYDTAGRNRRANARSPCPPGACGPEKVPASRCAVTVVCGGYSGQGGQVWGFREGLVMGRVGHRGPGVAGEELCPARVWGEDVGGGDGLLEASAGQLRHRTSGWRAWEPAKGLLPGDEMLACVLEGSLISGWRRGLGQAGQEGWGGERGPDPVVWSRE